MSAPDLEKDRCVITTWFRPGHMGGVPHHCIFTNGRRCFPAGWLSQGARQAEHELRPEQGWQRLFGFRVCAPLRRGWHPQRVLESRESEDRFATTQWRHPEGHDRRLMALSGLVWGLHGALCCLLAGHYGRSKWLFRHAVGKNWQFEI